MKNLPFITELTEARMFYDGKDLKGRSAEDIAGLAYLIIMLLQIIRYDYPSQAKSYASDTARYKQYETMHYSATDLSNLLAVLNNQENFDDKIKANTSISIPLFAINRYIDDVRSGSIDRNSDASFFYRLEDFLRLYHHSVFRKLRRDVGDWSNLTQSNKTQVINLIRREFDSKGSSIDLYLWFKQSYRLRESIEHDEPLSELNTGIRYNKTLNVELWDGSRLRSDVAVALNKIAERFIEFIDVDEIQVEDVIITGSNCAFNYSDSSDIDLHILVNTEKLGDNPLTDPFLRAKKALWNSGHDITVKGFDVELYAEDLSNTADSLVATGIYSLWSSKWIKKPTYQTITYDDLAVQTKAQDIIDQIKYIINNRVDDRTDIDRLWTHIMKMRKSGLVTGGEWSVENLAFKAVRNNGYLDKLSKYEARLDDQDLTLEHRDDSDE